MQQNCVLGPIQGEMNAVSVYLTVEDVTETVFYQRRLVELAIKDGLTAAFNRRFFDIRLIEEIERARRYSHELSLILLDIDLFKALNDRFGHQFGDEALKSLVSVCQGAVRTTDIVSRYGGEEFCVILPETGIAEAAASAERLRQAVETRIVSALGKEAKMTISLGVSAIRPNDDSAALLERADAGLYAAKAAGRNRVEVVQ
jgi:diguanylate cyclase (GGDEF)-like protein